MQYGPDPNAIYPNEEIKSICYIKNVITRPNIIVGDYTYYDDANEAEKFEEHVLYHYEFYGDKLIIGKFCAIARGIKFVMNGANHRMNTVTTYPFSLMGGGWEKTTPKLEDLPSSAMTCGSARMLRLCRAFILATEQSSQRILLWQKILRHTPLRVAILVK